MKLDGMKIMLLGFVGTAVLIALTIIWSAAPEVTMAQRVSLGSIPIAVSILITWLAWEDA